MKRSSTTSVLSNIGRTGVAILAFFVLLFSGTFVNAQVANYSFSQSSGTYTPIASPTVLGVPTGNSLAASLDNIIYNIPDGSFPFPFTFNGTAYTGCNVSTNGFITFGATAPLGSNYSPISSTAGYNSVISAWARDLNSIFDVGGYTGSLSWGVEGTSPNREIIIQWAEWRPQNNGTATDVFRMNFQVRLLENGNIIKIVYGPSGLVLGAPSVSNTVQVGLRGTANTDYNNRTATTSWTTTTAGGSNSASMSFTSTNMPASGNTFTWAPPLPCVAPTSQPTALVLTPASATNIGGSFTAASPSVDRYLVVRTTGAVPTTPVDGTTYTTGAGLGGQIVSVGTSTTFTDNTGLAGNTSYTYYVFGYNSVCSGGPLYNTASPLTGTASTCPVVPASITTSAITTTGFSLSWNSSLGGGASPITYTVEVATDNAFANQVVGSPFTVSDPTVTQAISGLTGGTTYYYHVRANGSCNSAFSTTASVQTQCLTPTSQATALVLTPASTSVGGSFTAASPAVTGYLVVRTTGAVPNAPVNGTTYTTGNNVGLNGNVVYVGTGTTFNNTGLTGNTSYTYYVYSYNSNCTGSPYYNTASPLTLSTITCPAVPGTITTSGVTVNSFNINWASTLGGNASPVTYTVEVSTNSTFTQPVAGSPFTVSDPTVTQAVAGLNHSTTYFYRVRANGSCSSAFSTAGNVNTTCATVTSLPWTENFDAIPTVSATAFPPCWSKTSGSSWRSANAGTTTYDSDSRSTPNFIQIPYSSSNAFIWTPFFHLTAGQSYDLSFWYVGYTGLTGWTGDVFVNTSQSGTGATQVGTSFITSTVADPTAYTQVRRTYVAPTTGDYTFAVRINSNGTPWYLSFDDFMLEPTPTCYVPNAVTVNTVNINTATATWTAPTLGTAPANYIWKVVPNGSGPNAPAVVSGIVAAPGLSASITGLAPSTAYQVYVKSDCGGTDSSLWTGSSAFTTLCAATNIPYVMPITGITPPALPSCVSIQNVNNDANTWRSYNAIGNVNGWNYPVLGYPYHATNNANDWLYTQGLNLVAGTNYILKFKYNNDGQPAYPEKLKVMYGTAPFAGSMTNFLADYPNVSNDYPQMAYIPFTPAVSGVYFIGFQAYSDADNDFLLLDDISVDFAPTCQHPENLLVLGLTGTQGTLSWSTPSIGTPANYIWKVVASGTGVNGTAISQGIVAAPGTSVLVTGLTANSNYDVYMRSDCGGGDTSTWINTSFTTGYCSPAPSSVDGTGITRVVMGTINNPTSTETNNYGNYSSMVTNVISGQPFPINITYSTGYTYGTIIWVDLNQNFVFENSEILYYGLSGAASPTTLAASITIPSTVASGLYRIRIGGTDTDSGPSGPCYNGTYGTFEDYTLNVIHRPSAPSSLTQSAQAPSCTGGSVLHALPAAPANVTYYLQATATDTSTANPFVGDSITIATNGVYFVNAKNTVTHLWSTGSATITVTNIPVAPLPPSPVAAQNPACLTTDISVPASVDPDVTYYWQGTNQFGTSTAQNASTPLTVTASGTYYVAAYDAASTCWSNTSGIAVVIGTVVPAAPIVNPVSDIICLGETQLINAGSLGGLVPIYTENFEGTLSMTAVNNSTGSNPANAAWTIRPDGYQNTGGTTVYTFHSANNSNFILSNSDAIGTGAATNTTITSPSINTTGYTGLSLSFDHYIQVYGTSSSKVQVSTNGGTSWTTIQDYTANVGTPGGFVHATLNLNAYVGAPDLRIRFAYTAGWSWFWALDNVVLSGNLPVATSWTVSPTADAGLPTGAGTPSIPNASISVTPTAPGTYVYSAVVSTADGCVSTASTSTITVNGLPTVDAGATQFNVCPVTSDVTLNGSGTGVGTLTYTWDNGVVDNTPFSAPNVNTLYTLTGTDGNGCSNTDTVSIFVAPTTPVSITPAGPIVTCQNDPVTLTANGPANGPQQVFTQWDFNSSNINPTTGSGTAVAIGGVTTTFASGSGSTDPGPPALGALNTETYPSQGTASKTAGVQFNVSTVGYANIKFKYDTRHSNTAANKYVIQYNPDVTSPVANLTWVSVDSASYSITTPAFVTDSVDFSAIPAANNNANFGIRIVSAFADGGSVYAPANTANTYATSGTVRYDMVTFVGQPLGATYSWSPVPSNSPSYTPTQSGTYVVVVNENNGTCPGVDSVAVTVNPIFTTAVNATICADATYELADGTQVNTTNIYTTTVPSTVTGCDSTVVVNLTVNPIYNITLPDVTICSNDNYTLANGDVVTTAGTYTRTVNTVNTCDSTVTVTVLVIPAQLINVNDTICAGDSLQLPNGSYVHTAGNYPVTFTAANTCDSTIVTHLFVKPVFTSTQSHAICNGDTHTMPDGSTQGTVGTYVFPFNAVNGCDSTITVNLTVNPTPTTDVSVDLCPGDTYTLVDGTVINSSGVFTAVTNTVNGCDSTVIVTATLRLVYNNQITHSMCQGDSYTLVNGNVVTTSGTYTSATQSIYGCDSIVTVVLTVNPVYNQTVTAAICQGASHTLPNGQTVTAAGSYPVTLQSSKGCDSTIVTQLTVNPVPNVNLGSDIVVMNPPVTLNAGVGFTSYLWTTGATTTTISVTQNGTYGVTVTNQFGCTATDEVQVNFTASVVELGKSGASVSLFPNPTADRFAINVFGYNDGDLRLDVINAIGQVVKTEMLANPSDSFTKEFDVTTLATGTYTVRIRGNNAEANLRVVIAR